MKKLLQFLICIAVLTGTAFSGQFGLDNCLYLSQEKEINGSYTYCLPKLVLNKRIWVGNFLGTPCNYLSKFEGALVYTAPRSNAFALNHHSVEGNWNLGVEVGPFFGTYSLGGVFPLAGNSSGLTDAYLFNLLSLGVYF